MLYSTNIVAAVLREEALSTIVLPQTPLQGFGYIRNVYSLYFPDRLHQSNRGTPEEVTRLLEARLTATQKHSLNAYLLACPSFHGFRMPSFGLDTSRRATATKIADLFKLLPVAILAFTSLRATFLPALQGSFSVPAHQKAMSPTITECMYFLHCTSHTLS